MPEGKRMCGAGKHDLDEVGVIVNETKGHTRCRGCKRDNDAAGKRRNRARERRANRTQDVEVRMIVPEVHDDTVVNMPFTPVDWQEYAACQGEDPELFFGQDEEDLSEAFHRVKVAKRICADCPVRAECLEYALETNQEHGVWGGESAGGRRRIKTDRRKVALAA